ncbi:MAG: hypothetical protein GXY67_14665 [Clostridiales bacterium]|nr:hypothetical protein [Clostridiales bacterium]
MNNEMIKRYMYAVTSNLPAKAQPEIEKELESMIEELLDARCGDVQPGDEDIRAVLTELGSPEEMAVRYSGDENKALISGIYLIWYKKILRIVLPIAAACVAFALLLSVFVKWQPPREAVPYVSQAIATIISGAANAAVQAFLWITVIFIILERKKVNFSNSDFLSDLPPVPHKQAQIKFHQPIIGILWHIAAAVLILGFPYLIGIYSKSTGWIPVFDEGYIRASWYLVVLWSVSEIACEIAKLMERRYSKRLALITAVTHLVTGFTAAVFFLDNRIMNPVFVQKIGALFQGGSAAKIGRALGHGNSMVAAIVLFALLADLGETIYRAVRYDG